MLEIVWEEIACITGSIACTWLSLNGRPRCPVVPVTSCMTAFNTLATIPASQRLISSGFSTASGRTGVNSGGSLSSTVFRQSSIAAPPL